MKIDYPVIEWADVQPGDTILCHWQHTDKTASSYAEFVVGTQHSEPSTDATYYLIDRPRPVMPQEPGTFIIAKKVRGVEFPEGIVLRRNKAQKDSTNAVYWMSDEEVPDMGIYGRPRYYDRHPETKIEDWVLAKVVPA